MARLYPSDIVEQARAVSGAWNKIDPALKFGDLTRTLLEADITAAAPLQSQLDEIEAQLTDLRNKRDALCNGMWDKIKRVRNAVKGIYGDDSSQYEMVGGTRLSERKPVARKQPVP